MSPTRTFAAIAPFFGNRVYAVIGQELGAKIQVAGADQFQRRIGPASAKPSAWQALWDLEDLYDGFYEPACVSSTHHALLAPRF
jgi:hypothetical protein